MALWRRTRRIRCRSRRGGGARRRIPPGQAASRGPQGPGRRIGHPAAMEGPKGHGIRAGGTDRGATGL